MRFLVLCLRLWFQVRVGRVLPKFGWDRTHDLWISSPDALPFGHGVPACCVEVGLIEEWSNPHAPVLPPVLPPSPHPLPQHCSSTAPQYWPSTFACPNAAPQYCPSTASHTASALSQLLPQYCPGAAPQYLPHYCLRIVPVLASVHWCGSRGEGLEHVCWF